MTTEQHRILYNMGSPISCNHSNKLHLCPNENSYKYFVYWSEVRKEDGTKFGNAVDEKKVQLKRQTGEEEAFLGEDIPICQKCMEERRVEMFLAHSCGKEECANLLKDLDFFLIQYIRDVSIERTLVLKENTDEWDMPMIDFTDAFDERALLTHFRSLIYCFIEEVDSGGQVTALIGRMTDLFHNWEKIYEEKEGVLKQIEHYMHIMIAGLESVGEVPGDLRYSHGSIKKDFSMKENAEDNLSFLLLDEYNRECFRECVTILDALLRAYAKDEAEVLLRCLGKYKNEDLQINKIRKLSKIDLQSSKAKKANVKLIKEYLAVKVRCSLCVLFECIA